MAEGVADGFLQRYAEELGALRRRAARFAEAHPKIARRLRISGETGDDPHVERIVQSFAYVAARIRQKLDDEFPELTGSMLEALYPHYLAPVPAMTMVRLSPAAGIERVQRVPRGSEIVAEPLSGEQCRFRTTQDVDVAPLSLVAAKLGAQPIEAPVAPHLKAAACLRLTLAQTDPEKPFAAAGVTRLRFHIRAPWREATALYELVHNHTVGIALARHADDPGAVFLPRARLRPAGFDEDEGMLPYPPSSFLGYRLLTEFFALPQKFLFLEIDGLDGWRAEAPSIFLYLDESHAGLERILSATNFVLNVTPAVNLFEQRAEPIVVDGLSTEYPLVPDARRHATREIYGVTGVTLTDRDGRRTASPALFEPAAGGETLRWQIDRRHDPAEAADDLTIAFVHPSGPRRPPEGLVASVDTLCFNRDLPAHLPYGGGHPRLAMRDPTAGVDGVEALAAPTPVLRLEDDDERRWRLVSHLNLNHLSLADPTGGALKEMLRLYTVRDRRETNLMIDAIVAVAVRPATARLGNGGMVPGTDIAVSFDPAQIDRAGAFLFGSLLDRFFALYTTINSFTRLTVSLAHRSESVTWPARAGARPLL